MIDDEDVKLINYASMVHPFNVRMLKATMNGGGADLLLQRKGEYILLDTYYSYTTFMVLNYPDSSSKILCTDLVAPVKIRFPNLYGKPI